LTCLRSRCCCSAAAAAAAASEFSQATVSCFDPLEQQAAKNRVKSVAQTAATAVGKQHYNFHSTQQQQQVELCPATQQGLKHWVQASQAAGIADIWPDLWAGSAADLEGVLSKAFAAGFGQDLEESTLQHYVSTTGEQLLLAVCPCS
jgi:hypothetical protein